MKISVKKNERPGGALHYGEITGAESGQIYTFGIYWGSDCERSIKIPGRKYKWKKEDGTVEIRQARDRKEYIDGTGWVHDRGCEWWIRFDQNDLPDVYCRSDHDMAKRLALAIVTAYEAGLKNG